LLKALPYSGRVVNVAFLVVKDHPGGKHHHECQPEIEEKVVEDGLGN
jgi:hypothetical protein